MPSDSSAAIHYIPTLDGWRTIAVSMVVFSHIGLFWITDERMMQAVASLGGQGVALFFAISGYLITTLLLRERRDTGGISLMSFYIRRVFRIIPPAMFYLSVLYVIELCGVIVLKRGELLASLLFFNNYWPERSWFTAHFWSLSVEEHFYGVWPVLMLTGVRFSVMCAIAVIVVTLAWRPYGFAVNLGTYAIQRTDMRLDAFMFAALAAVLCEEAKLDRLCRWRWLFSVTAIVIIAVYAAALLNPQLRNLKEATQSALMPVLVISTVYAPAHSFVWRILQLSPMKIIGQWSYSIYLWQELFLTSQFPGPIWLRFAGLAVAVYCSYTFVEGPARRFARRLIRQHIKQRVEIK